jgi:hypothetical protein
MYNQTDVIWCYAEDVKYHKGIGFQVYKHVATEQEADRLSEEACYLPL